MDQGPRGPSQSSSLNLLAAAKGSFQENLIEQVLERNNKIPNVKQGVLSSPRGDLMGTMQDSVLTDHEANAFRGAGL